MAGCAGEIRWSGFKGVSLQMFGTNSGGKVAFDIKDSGSEMWRFVLEDNFSGWNNILYSVRGIFPVLTGSRRMPTVIISLIFR